MFDANDDGHVDKEEFAAMYESLSAGGITKPADDVFAELDRNADGNIVFNDYVKFLKVHAEVRQELGCAAHAAATARYNYGSDTGVEEGAAPSAVCPDKVVEVTD